MYTTSTDNTKKLHVVMVVQSLPPEPSGGAEIQALRLAEKLIQKNVNVIFISPGSAKFKGHSQINNVPVYRLYSRLSYLTDLLFFIKRNSRSPQTVIEYDDSKQVTDAITRKIGVGARLRYRIFIANALSFLEKRKDTIDIIHSHTIEWPGYAAAVLSKKLNKRLIVKDSTMNGIFNILRFPSGKNKQGLIIERAHFVAMTKAIRYNLEKAHVNPQNITDIPNGISVQGPFKTGYENNTKVLFVGNLYQQPAKGIDILLKAWKRVVEQVPAARLEIAGDGDINAYREYCKKMGINESVDFLGKHPDVDSLMLNADVFVLPSRREGMPNVLMEAMLRGLPCVATDISGSHDLIENGVSGLLVKSPDVNALSEQIIFLLKNRKDAAAMAMNARKKIIESYDIDKIANEYLKLYRR
jgi:glycosyltransferase involved in cell wall biosynthesis